MTGIINYPPTRPKRNIKDSDRSRVIGRGVCLYCGDLYGPFEVDHIRSLSRGGTNDIDNLACSCVSCNTQKANFHVHEWKQWRLSNGMFWPPVAQHATEPIHFQDGCKRCSDASDLGSIVDYIFPAKYMEIDEKGNGYKCYYRCSQNHVWTCWYSAWNAYYSDCPCNYCTTCRSESEME